MGTKTWTFLECANRPQTLTGIETFSDKHRAVDGHRANRPQTLTGIETRSLIVVTESSAGAPIDLKPLQGLKPNI